MCKLCDKVGEHVAVLQLNITPRDEKNDIVDIWNCGGMQAFIEYDDSQKESYYTFNIESSIGTKSMTTIYQAKVKCCPLCGRSLEKQNV